MSKVQQLTTTVASLALLAGPVTGGRGQSSDSVAASLQPLTYLIGYWEADVELLDPAGRVRDSARAEIRVAPGLDGVVLEERGALLGTAIAARSVTITRGLTCRCGRSTLGAGSTSSA